VGYSKFFMYSGHGEFHEYSNFMKVMLVVYFEPSLQKLAKLKQVSGWFLGKGRFLGNMVLCTKFVESVDNFIHTLTKLSTLSGQ
jgi:hypothetical protein